MIQRIQSVYLLLAALLNAGVFFTPLFDRAAEDPSLWIKSGLSAGLLLAAVVSVWAIFRFNNRPDQMRWIKRAILLQVLALGAAAGLIVTLGGFGAFMYDELASAGLLMLAVGAQFGAFRGVRADEELVRSMDRLR